MYAITYTVCAYCYMIVKERGIWPGSGSEVLVCRRRAGMFVVGSGVRPVGLGAKRTVVGGAASSAGGEHASCGTWRGTWHLGASGGARRGGANKL